MVILYLITICNLFSKENEVIPEVKPFFFFFFVSLVKDQAHMCPAQCLWRVIIQKVMDQTSVRKHHLTEGNI